MAGLTNNRHAVKVQELALEATERTIREAKSVKALTILGVVFVSLAYVATLFSMSDLYGPGEQFFGVFCGCDSLDWPCIVGISYSGAGMHRRRNTVVISNGYQFRQGEHHEAQGNTGLEIIF